MKKNLKSRKKRKENGLEIKEELEKRKRHKKKNT